MEGREIYSDRQTNRQTMRRTQIWKDRHGESAL